jgi:predicted GIY-YIG superfamily endonuclease
MDLLRVAARNPAPATVRTPPRQGPGPAPGPAYPRPEGAAEPAMTAPLNERPHALYRFYDAGDVLLYVGITAALPARLNRHNDDKPWWGTVSRITVEHFKDRANVLAAERTAIQAECPLHNIQHNMGGRQSTRFHGRTGAIPPGTQTWTFASLHSGFRWTEPLWLYWEVHCDPISDSYRLDEVEASDLWREWLRQYPRDEHAEAIYGPGAVSISWYVEGPSTCEAAPFRDLRRNLRHWNSSSDYSQEDNLTYEQQQQFLTHYTWPTNPTTGEPLRWPELPVIDKVWRTDNLPPTYATKGGFIQEATGWKPSPLQPYMDVRQIGRAARLYVPEEVQI